MKARTSHPVCLPLFFASALAATAYELPSPGIPQSCSVQMKDNTFNAETLELVHSMGFRIVRRGVYWGRVESEKGQYDFSLYDAPMDKARDLGLTVIVTLFGGNGHYDNADEKGGIVTDEGRRGFAAFAAAAAAHWRGRDVIFEIWNEPNVRTFWRKSGTHNSEEFASEYTALVKEAVPSMLRADPDCFVVAGSVSNYWEPSYQWTDFCFRLGILSSGIRGWSVHPYGVKSPEDFAKGHAVMRSLLKKYGAPDLPLLDTERGFTATKRDEGWSGGAAEKAFEYQAWHVVRQNLADIMDGLPVTSWYELRGNEGFALFDGDKPRPAAKAFQTMVAELSGYSFERRLEAESPRDVLAIFKNTNGDRKLVAWTTPPPGGSPDETAVHAIVIPAKDSAAFVPGGTTLLGEVMNTAWGIGLSLSGAPVYLPLNPGFEPGKAVSVGPAVLPTLPGGGAPAPAGTVPLDLAGPDAPWKFIPNTGRGSVALGTSSDGKPCLTVAYDFTASKSKSTPYVMATCPAEIPAGAVSLAVSARTPTPQQVTMRVTDATGQTLQHKVRARGTGEWEPLAMPLNRKLEHWDGANDGYAHFPLKSVVLSLPKTGDTLSGQVEFADFGYVGGGAAASAPQPAAVSAPPPAAPATPASTAAAPELAKAEKGPAASAGGRDLALFASGTAWQFVKNTGDGSFTLGTAADGTPIGTLAYDFTKSTTKNVPYVLATVPIDVAEGAKAIAFHVRAPIAQKLTMRVSDATGQTLQFKASLKGTGDWERIRFPLDRKLEHWDGANDGFAHFPLKTFCLSVPRPATAASGVLEFSVAVAEGN